MNMLIHHKNPNDANAGYSVLHTTQGLKIQF